MAQFVQPAEVSSAQTITGCQYVSQLSILVYKALEHHNQIMKLDSKYFDSIRKKTKTKAAAPPQTPVCQWDGCEADGAHRAPVGRHADGQYFLFCFDHVREYNKGYNYFSV